MKNKKLFAILTLVAFMLTMMPVMAFATTTNQIGAWVEDGNAIVGDGSKDSHDVVLGFEIPALEDNERVYVFTTLAGTNEVYKPAALFATLDSWVNPGDFTSKGYVDFGITGYEGQTFTVIVNNATAVELDVKAVLVKDIKNAADFSGVTPDSILNKVSSGVEFTYANVAWDTDNTVEFVDKVADDIVIAVTGIEEKDKNNDTYIDANNGLDYYEVTIKVTNNDKAVKGAEVDVVVNKIGAEVNAATVTTNARGVAKFNVFASKAGSYEVTLSTKGADDLTIRKVATPTAGVHNYDLKFGTAAVGNITPAATSGNYAVDHEFDVVMSGTDMNGNALSYDQVYTVLFTDAVRAFEWVKVPEDSAFDVNELAGPEVRVKLDNAKAQTTLGITPDAEGDYTLKLYDPTTGSKVAYINFTAKEYEKTVSLAISYSAATYNAGAVVPAPTVTYTDINGTKITNYKSVNWSYTGVGVKTWTGNGSFVLESEERFLGKEIVVNAVSDGCFATATVKIADIPAYLQFVQMAPAGVGTEATVVTKSLDLSGNVAALGDATVTKVDYVVTSKPAGAVVSVVTGGLQLPDFANKGQSAIKVASTKEGTVTINVVVTTSIGKYLTGVAEVQFGDVVTPVQTSATLIINSNIFVANGGVQTAPAAPVIIDGRTYLPIRAVGQAIGANVDYVDGVITLTLGAQKATMVPGSNVMTVGTETVTMDAAPYLAGDGHTMVPVRYAAQAFGYELGTTANADGSVATVTVFK